MYVEELSPKNRSNSIQAARHNYLKHCHPCFVRSTCLRPIGQDGHAFLRSCRRGVGTRRPPLLVGAAGDVAAPTARTRPRPPAHSLLVRAAGGRGGHGRALREGHSPEGALQVLLATRGEGLLTPPWGEGLLASCVVPCARAYLITVAVACVGPNN